MTKKATKAKNEQQIAPNRNRAVKAVRRSSQPEVEPPALDDLTLNAVIVEAQQRTFASEQEALAFFYDKLLSKSAEDSQEEAQMREFLELLVETDPKLKADLLSAVRVRK